MRMKGQFLITVESQLINGERTMEIKNQHLVNTTCRSQELSMDAKIIEWSMIMVRLII